MFGPENHVPRPDFQDGWRLEGSGDGKQGELGQATLLAVALRMVLAMKELETSLDVQGLRGTHIHISR